MDWYAKAGAELLEKLETLDWVDGVRFLRDYLLELDEDFVDMEEEEQDIYIINALEDFEEYLKENYGTRINIGKKFRWLRELNTNEIQPNVIPVDEFIITEQDYDLLKLDAESFNKEQIVRCHKLVKILHKKNIFGDCFNFAEKYNEILEYKRAPDSEKLSMLSISIDAAKAMERVDLYDLHCKKAEIYICNYEHENAASEYEVAVGLLTIGSSRLKSKIANLSEITKDIFRRCRIQYENAGFDDKASEIYVQENIYAQSSLNLGIQRGLMFVFWGLAQYGESPRRVACWAGALVIICSFFYMYTGVNPPSGLAKFSCTQGLESNIMNCRELEVNIEVSYWSYLYYSVVTFTTLGYGDFSPLEGTSRLISAFQAVMGLLLTSLFLATFIKKYSR